MLELAAHILDIAENSVRAGAKLVEITIDEDTHQDLLALEIKDDGHGMDAETIQKVLDPFYTTKTVRRVGLGLPLLKEATTRAGGDLTIESRKNHGTKLTATFGLSHIDRQPLGDIAGTLVILIIGNSEVDFFYKHRHNDRRFVLDTREIRKEIDEVPISHPDVINYIRDIIEQGVRDIRPDA